MQEITDNILILTVIGFIAMLIVAVVVILLHRRYVHSFLKQQTLTQQMEIAHQEELLHAVINSQEQERKRIGQDLHDDVGTALSNLRINIEIFNKKVNSEYPDFINLSKKIIDKVIDDIRVISHNLCPSGIDTYGLIGSLEELFEGTDFKKKLTLTTSPEAMKAIKLFPPETALSLYRISEELLNNSIKHSKATRIQLEFTISDNQLKVAYQDNGIGLKLSAPSKGMGLHNIESRMKMISAVKEEVIPNTSGYHFNFLLPL